MSARHGLGAALVSLACATPLLAAQAARIETRLTYVADERAPLWRVEISARGLAEPPELELENWGEWLRLDDYYLRDLVAEPPLERQEERQRFRVRVPEEAGRWDGELRLAYDLPVVDVASHARERFGLLPFRTGRYTYGFSANTLMAVEADAERWIEIVGPPGARIASGFGPPATTRLRARIPEGFGNTAIAIGTPVAEARGEAGGVPVHVVQLGGAAPIAEPLARFAERFLETCTRALGVPPSRELSLIVTEPGFGGTRTDGAISVGCPEGFDGTADAGTLHFLAHELFHDWLGGRLQARQGERLAWFWEGFTDYLSLWHLTALDLVPRERFAARLLELEAELAQNEHWGRVSFADLEVSWRDPAIEPLAYHGSALAAFALDVALREAGKPGLGELLRALLAQDGGRYELASIRAWILEQGLEPTWEEHFVAGRRVAPRPLLVGIGYEEVLRPRELAYVGLRLDADGPFGAVAAVDPDGPSAGLVRTGDVVSGLTPTHDAIEGAEAAAPEYPFGLAHYEPTERVRIDVHRQGERLEIWVAPRRIAGPPASVLQPGAELDAFFR